MWNRMKAFFAALHRAETRQNYSYSATVVLSSASAATALAPNQATGQATEVNTNDLLRAFGCDV